ncbi:PepSY domain-containing protein [Alkanindiges sp. WGS2144]|uniref:PepSY domain-containing protein n=1 Tax=Alkanindiges sp. WGS2144 TaxID=3366808 RepID=UPI00375211B2
MPKKILFQLHWFFGITAGLILSIMGVTGALFSYEKQITRAIHPASFEVQAQASPVLNPAQLYKTLSSQYPHQKINSITVTGSATQAASVNFDDGSRRGKTYRINPYTAERLPAAKSEDFFKLVENIHRYLALGEFAKLWSDHPEQWRQYGKQLTGISAIALIYFVLSGIYLRWPRNSTMKEWLFIKKNRSGRSFLWNLHAVVGTWVIIFYLLLALTGLTWSYSWYRTAVYTALGTEQTQPRPKLPDAQSADSDITVPAMLDQSWQAFNDQVSSYSTASFKIPAHNTTRIEITFVDAIPQHERARNMLKYNVVKQQVEELSFYKDKPLNAQLAAGLLPVHRGSFFGPVWQFLTMLAALSMPLFFITGWMLYLKQRKQKKLTLAAQQLASIPSGDQAPWLIVYASQTGFAEQMAWSTAKSLQQANFPAQVIAIDQLNIEQLKSTTNVLFVVSTYGQGEPPDHARLFARKQLKIPLELEQLNYAVLALGDREYPHTYCDFGRQLDQWLTQSNANPLFELITVNNGSTDDLLLWNQALRQVTRQQLDSVIVEKVFDDWQLVQRTLLNPGSLGEPAFDIRLHATHEAVWKAGDIAEIQPGNSDQAIQTFIDTYQLSANIAVQQHGHHIRLFDALRYLNLRTQDMSSLNAQQLVEQLPSLPTREYSIASIPQDGYLGLVIRQSQTGEGLGLGSGWLTAYAALQQPIHLRIRTNESFHAPDDNRPVILIGNGTGIAGLMSILKDRERHGFNCNWLIFGERQRDHDFFFADQLQSWLAHHHLQHLDLAFSRDQKERLYVQHRLAAQAELLKTWVAQGASIYVCGSIEGMAPAIDQILTQLLGENLMEQLIIENRYRRDVY